MADKYLCETCACDENHYEAIQRVRKLHTVVMVVGLSYCDECGDTYPCDTIKTLEGEK